MPKPPQILTIEPPEELCFKGPFTEVVTSYLKLRNASDNRIAFKVKTTAPKRYCVRPNSGTLSKNEEVTVSVMLQPFDFDPAEKTKHKFMIQSIRMEGDVAEADLWKSATAEQLMDTKLRVLFENEPVVEEKPANIPVAPQPAQNDLDQSVGHDSPLQKANVKVPSTEDDYQKVKSDNNKLSQEVKDLKEECSRLRKIAMRDTMSAGAAGQQQAGASQLPSGVQLLLLDKNNILLIISLLIAAFAVGLILSDNLLGSATTK